MVDENAVKRFFNVNKLSVTDISKKVGVPEAHVSAILAGEEYVPEEVVEETVDETEETTESEDKSTDEPKNVNTKKSDSKATQSKRKPKENVEDEDKSTAD